MCQQLLQVVVQLATTVLLLPMVLVALGRVVWSVRARKTQHMPTFKATPRPLQHLPGRVLQKKLLLLLLLHALFQQAFKHQSAWAWCSQGKQQAGMSPTQRVSSS